MDSSIAAKEYSEDLLLHLYTQFSIYLSAVKEHTFTPVIYFNGSEPKEFAALPLSHFSNYMPEEFSSISQVLETYYATRNQLTVTARNPQICVMSYRLHWNGTVKNTISNSAS